MVIFVQIFNILPQLAIIKVELAAKTLKIYPETIHDKKQIIVKESTS
jgi:hypothetical protein